MKCLKMLGLAAVAAAALMAFVGAGTASATTLTNNGVRMNVGDTLDASVTKSALLATTGGTTIATCTEGTVHGVITDAGADSPENKTVKGEIETLSWGGCNTTVDTVKAGTLEVHNIASTSNGTVTSSGAEVTINVGGISCTYGTSNTDIGTLTSGKPGLFDISATIPKVAGSFLCPSSGVWSGQYTITVPSGPITVDP